MRPSNICEQAASASSGSRGESAHPPQIVGTSLQTNRRRDWGLIDPLRAVQGKALDCGAKDEASEILSLAALLVALGLRPASAKLPPPEPQPVRVVRPAPPPPPPPPADWRDTPLTPRRLDLPQ